MSLFFIWHFACSSFFGLLAALVFGSLNSLIAVLVLILGAMASYFVSRADAASKTLFIDPKNRSTEILWLERVAIVFVFYLCYRHFLYLFYSTGNELKTLNPNNFGDLPLHINYIRLIASGAEFPWVNPSFASSILRYPMGIDLYNALWESVGVRLPAHLFLVGMIGSVLTIRFLRMAAGWWGIIGFFLSGGFALATAQSDLAWKNLFLAVFVTQRGFLFALPVGLYLILRARRPEKLSWTFGCLWGLLAFFHLHSFVIVSLILAGESIIRRDVKKFFTTLAISVPIGSAFVLYSSQGLNHNSLVRWRLGWMNNGHLFWFLHDNFGLYFYFAIAFLTYLLATQVLKRFKKPELKPLTLNYLLYLSLFVLFFNLMLAPWEWDNVKVLIWPYLLLLGCWAQVCSRLKAHGVQLLIAIGLGAAGVNAVIPSLLSTRGALTIYNKGELANTEAALMKTPKTAVFLAATTHHHPLTYFGKVRALGYGGHLWSHGINATEQNKKMERIFADDPQWRDLARDLRVTHIYWGREERTQFGEGPRAWQIPENNVSKVDEIAVYEIK